MKIYKYNKQVTIVFMITLHPNAPFGALQKVKFGDFLPGSKGFKRAPTQEEIDFLNNLFK